MPKLLDQVRHIIRLKHYSIRTEQAYIHWIKQFILFHNKRHPADMAESEVSDFLSSLAVKKDVASSTQSQALSAILFLYRDVLRRPLDRLDHIQRAKRRLRWSKEMRHETVLYCDHHERSESNLIHSPQLR